MPYLSLACPLEDVRIVYGDYEVYAVCLTLMIGTAVPKNKLNGTLSVGRRYTHQ